VLVECDHEARDSERGGVVRARGDRRMRMMDRAGAVFFVQACPAEAAVIAKRERGVRRRVVRSKVSAFVSSGIAITASSARWLCAKACGWLLTLAAPATARH
jgi:hypothetical protein